MTYPEEFNQFFEAMKAKMLKKREEKGDTWKDTEAIYDYYDRYPGCTPPAYKTMPMDKWLREKLTEETKEYFDGFNPEELIDIANCCAMLYCRAAFHNSNQTEESK